MVSLAEVDAVCKPIGPLELGAIANPRASTRKNQFNPAASTSGAAIFFGSGIMGRNFRPSSGPRSASMMISTLAW